MRARAPDTSAASGKATKREDIALAQPEQVQSRKAARYHTWSVKDGFSVQQSSVINREGAPTLLLYCYILLFLCAATWTLVICMHAPRDIQTHMRRPLQKAGPVATAKRHRKQPTPPFQRASLNKTPVRNYLNTHSPKTETGS